MRKRFNFLLILLLLGAVSASAQDQYYLRFYANDGNNPNGNVSYLNYGAATGTVNFVTAPPTDTRQITWEFEPVGENEPGWYYIKHVYSGNYLVAPATMGGNNTFQINTKANAGTQTYRLKYRLIKTTTATTSANNPTLSRYKIAARNGNTNYVLRRRNNSTNLISNETFTADRGVVELIPVGNNWVNNSSQELVGTDTGINPSGGTWPAQPPTTDCHDFSGQNNYSVYDDGTTCYSGSAYTNLFPVGYTRTNTVTTRVIHSFYASGNVEGDGFYFSRMAKNDQLTKRFTNSSISATRTLAISFWVRAASKGAESESEAAFDKLDNTDNGSFERIMSDDQFLGSSGYNALLKDILKIPDGYVVGKMTATSASAGNIGVIPITVPSISTLLNDPEEWYHYRMTYVLPTSTGVNIGAVFTNLMNADDGLLDIDNITVREIIFTQDTEAFKFHYKDGAPQNVHVHTQVKYAMPGSEGYPDLITSATNGYAYYRWHIDEKLTQLEYLDYFDPESETYMRAGSSGIVYTSQSWTGTATSGSRGGVGNNGYQMNIIAPEWGSSGEWVDASDVPLSGNKFNVTVDAANYTNYTWNSTGLTEPSLSWRNVFEFRPAWEIAAEMNDSLNNGSVLEYYELDAPTGHRLRLTPKYTPTNYWITSNQDQDTFDKIVTDEDGIDLVNSQRFYWVQVEANADGTPSVAEDANPIERFANRIRSSNNYYFPRQRNSVSVNYEQFLQVNTGNKTHNQVEYFDVYVNSEMTTQGKDRKIARFKVTYKNRTQVGPISPSGDLLDRVMRKKLIAKLNFDQTGTPPAGWYDNRETPLILDTNNPKNNFSLGGFGTARLKQEESSYGFMDPRSHTYSGGSTIPSDNSYHINAGCGYWSEYSFPVAINHGITSGNATGFGRGWSTEANVYDRTSFNTGGTTTQAGDTLGNMLYVDASMVPGIFATLDMSSSVCPGTILYFSAWLVNLNGGSASSGIYENGTSNAPQNTVTTVRPNLVFLLKDTNSGKEIKRFYTGDIGMGAVGEWRQIAFEFEIPDEYIGSGGGENNVEFRLEIQNNGLGTTGNDFAMDEICIYRTNPSVIATRVTDVYCVPDAQDATAVDVSLDMEVEVDITQLDNVRRTYSSKGNDPTTIGSGEPGLDVLRPLGTEKEILYYRFLQPDGSKFPGDYTGEATADPTADVKPGGAGLESITDDPMYSNMGFYKKKSADVDDIDFYYGAVDLNALNFQGWGDPKDGKITAHYSLEYYSRKITDMEPEKAEEYKRTMYFDVICTNYSSGMSVAEAEWEYVLRFRQDIPAEILNKEGMVDGKYVYNHGLYHIYVAESDGSLLNPTCAGEASFNVSFDDTDFTAYVGAVVGDGTDPGELSVCTNQAVRVVATATNVNTNEPMTAFYDWYFGPVNTYPESALDYTYSVFKTLRSAAPPAPMYYGRLVGNVEIYDVLYFAEETTPGYYIVDNKTNNNPATLIEESDLLKEARTVVTDDGYADWYTNDDREKPSNASETWVNGKTWYNETLEGQEWAWAPVNYVGYNQMAGHFSYTTVDGVTSATVLDHDDYNNFENRTIEWRLIKEDLKAFRYFFPYADAIPEGTMNCLPIDRTKIENSSTYHYNYETGKIYDSSNNLIDMCSEALNSYRFASTEGYGKFVDRNNVCAVKSDLTDATAGPESGCLWYVGLDDEGLVDLNRLLARLRLSEKLELLKLHTNEMPVYVETMSKYYITAVPLDIALPMTPADATWENDRVEICTTPALVTLQASEWGADYWFGESNDNGLPSMPYLDIEDDNFAYTVRLPERNFAGDFTTTQFVTPLLYLDEVKQARVRLVDVLDETGTSVYTNPNGIGEPGDIINAYVGLIDPTNTNKLDAGHYIWIDYHHNDQANGRSEILPTPERNFTRWSLMDSRGAYRALESYPLIINSFNYFFDNPLGNHVLAQEGDPYPIGTEIGRVGKDPETWSGMTNYKEGDNILSHNRIGIEIMASDLASAVPGVGTKLIGDVRHYIPGYTYEFVLEGTSSKEFAETSACDLLFDFVLKVVPDTIIWGGTETNYLSEWNRDKNWYIPTKDDKTKAYTDTRSNNKTFPPLPETKVIIPAGLENYSVLKIDEFLPDVIEVTGYLGDIVEEETGWNPNKMMLTYDWEDAELKEGISATPYIEFDYNYVPNSCDTIHFKHGGEAKANAELVNQYLLNYNAAKVDLTLNTMQWYALSAPLRNMYSGDYGFPRLNPFVEMRYFNTANPQLPTHFLTDWSKPFNTTTEELVAGLGYSVRVGGWKYKTITVKDGTVNEETGTDEVTLGDTENIASQDFHFPHNDKEFIFYHEGTRNKTGTVQKLPTTGRDYRHRFIYEEDLEEPTKDAYGRDVITSVPSGNTLLEIPIKQNKAETKLQIIGNPLMSHIDFEKFYAANYALIYPRVRILKPNGSSYIAISGVDSDIKGVISNPITTDGKPTNDAREFGFQSIPPMQTFVVELREGVDEDSDDLVINKDMGVVNTASKLRSTMVETDILRMRVKGQYNQSSNAVVAFDSDYRDAFYEPEDTRLLINPNSLYMPNLFTISDGMYSDINRMESFPSSLPIGIKGGVKGSATLSFSGFEGLTTDLDIYFLDTEKDVRIQIEEDSYEYTFEYDGKESIGRFFLAGVLPSQNKADDLKSNLTVYSNQGQIEVLSLDGNPLKNVSVYGLDGMLLYRISDTGRTYLRIPWPGQSPIVLVKASTETSTIASKLINK